jgi:prolyl oligopeptidase
MTTTVEELAARLRNVLIWNRHRGAVGRACARHPITGASRLVPLLVVGVAVTCTAATLPPPPETRVEVVIDTLHGVAIPDHYRWLEDQQSPETRQWIEAQNAHTQSLLAGLPVIPRLSRRLDELMRVDRTGTRPREREGRLFVWKKRADDDLWILYLRQGLDGDDEVLIDPHTLSDDHTTDIKVNDISVDGKLLAYGVREAGQDEIEVHIHDVDRREDLADRLPRGLYTSVAFARDDASLIYGRVDRTSGETHVYEHVIGTGADEDRRLFAGELPANLWLSPIVSDDGRFLLIVAFEGWSRSELYVQDLVGSGPLHTIVDTVPAMFGPTFAGNQLIVQTDWQAPNRRLLAIDLDRLGDLRTNDPSSWREVVPERDDPIEGFSVCGGRVFVHSLHDVSSQIDVFDLDGNPSGAVELPGLGTASTPFGNWESPNAFFSFQSFTEPRTTYRLDVPSGEVEVWGRTSAPFDGADFVTQQVWYESRDGTRVPMFVVHRRGLELTGDHPTLLYGYGGFNVSEMPWFSSLNAVWLESGGVYALANIRGGGEYGEAWHRAGMLENKQNVFDDFIAAAEWLISEGYTSPARLAIRGGSNGGLLVGACLTQRPDLYRAVLCEYPDLDMVRYFQLPGINRPALAEYGDASIPAHFEFLRAYSPYQKVEDGVAYPAVLLTTGDGDTRVPPLQARKMTARLQAATSSGRPVLLHYDTTAGHAGGRPLSTQIEDSALLLAFLFWQLGVETE